MRLVTPSVDGQGAAWISPPLGDQEGSIAQNAGFETTPAPKSAMVTIADDLTNGGRIEVARRMAGNSNAKPTAPMIRRHEHQRGRCCHNRPSGPLSCRLPYHEAYERPPRGWIVGRTRVRIRTAENCSWGDQNSRTGAAQGGSRFRSRLRNHRGWGHKAWADGENLPLLSTAQREICWGKRGRERLRWFGLVAAQTKALRERAKALAEDTEEINSKMRSGDLSTETPESRRLRDSADCLKGLAAYGNAVAGTLTWGKENPTKIGQILYADADEEGNFKIPAQPGMYLLFASGRAGFNEAIWEAEIAVDPGTETTVKLASPGKACLAVR